tara:strand:+ start:374 stop:1270 length:897 start_codon:yes stop_codon:yes gene_type:complete
MNNLEMAPTINAPSIGSSAVLVELKISCWTGRKKDKTASREVTDQNYADKGTASVNKKLLGNCDELTAIQKFVASVRNINYASTMPWSDLGQRLLPTAALFPWQQEFGELESQFLRMRDSFCSNYTWEISRAEARLGNLFVREDYPTEDEIRSKFSFTVDILPLPDAGDFRTDIGAEAEKILREGYQNTYNKQLVSAMNDVWQRTYKALSSMSERLDYSGNDKKKVFRDTLVENVMDMVELLSVCNVTGDSQMEAMRLRLDDALRGVTPDGLRNSESLRVETKRVVDDAIKSLPSLGM